MAVHRPKQTCIKCGREIFAKFAKFGTEQNPFVGDSFMGWDYANHECPTKIHVLDIGVWNIKYKLDDIRNNPFSFK